MLCYGLYKQTSVRILQMNTKEKSLSILNLQSKEVLLDRVWGYDFGGNGNVVEVYVKQLRQKLEAGSEPRLLHTIRGVGYVLREEES